MNERIKELYKEATGKDWAYDFDPQVAEKFAELIIKMCGYHADVFSALGCPVDMDPTDTKPSDYIKKHFGVE